MNHYYVYILTNQNKTVLYVGITNNLLTRIRQHQAESKKAFSKTFVGQYQCHYLVYYEMHTSPNDAIAREKELKGWRREKKIALVNNFNPGWKFLNNEILGRET